MPKISVTEKDLSWYFRQREEGAATVYVPGIATFGPTGEPVLCNSSNFANTFGTKAVNVEGELSYNMAASYIKSGFNVLFHRVALTGAAPSSVTQGGDTDNVTFTAKYEGSFGNHITLMIRPMGTIKSSISTYVLIDGTVVETLTCDLVDPTSPNYYVNLSSEYITVTVTGDPTTIEFGSAASPLNLQMAGGKDFTDGATAEDIHTEVWTSIKTPGFLESLKDPYQYDYDIITSAGWSLYDGGPKVYGSDENAAWSFSEIDKVDAALFNLATARGTSIFLVDGKTSWEDSEMYTYCGLFDSSYAAGYGPWGYAQFTSTGVLNLLPGSYAMLVAWAQSCSDGTPIWMAPAGVKRATLGSFYKDTTYFVGKRTLDMWQNHDFIKPGQYSVNPVMKAKQYGYVIYGNSTLLKTTPAGATSMLQSFSVRVLANAIKVHAFDVALGLQFDQLTGDLFTQFRTLMTTYMDPLVYQGALYDYEIVLTNGTLTSADLNERTLPVTIRISPNPSADNFDITLEITQSGVSFSDDTDENEIA